MFCNDTALRITSTIPNGLIPGTVMVGRRTGPPLMVSDNPEIVTAKGPKVIWLHPESHNNNGEHRVFLWSVNGTGSDGVIGITIQNTGSSNLNITSIRFGEGQDPPENGVAIGQCLADLLLNGLFAPENPSAFLVAPGQIQVVSQFNWPQNRLIGAFIAFSVDQTAQYTLRSVYGPTGTDLTKLDSTTPMSVDTVHKHPRGSWEYSECEVNCGTFYINEGGRWNGKYYKLLADKNSSKAMIPFDRDDSWNKPESIDNRAPFGAVLHVHVPIINHCKSDIPLRFMLQAWGGTQKTSTGVTGTPYTGAVRMTDHSVWTIPTTLSFPNAAILTHPIYLAPPGKSQFDFDLAVGGESSAPARLIVF